MKNDDLNSVWIDIEVQGNSRERFYQRMVYVDLLYRAYIGSSGIPSKRFLSIEIPEGKIKEFDAFTVPKGFTLDIGSPGIKHNGYAACVIQAASSDLNDVFTIVAKDILDNLREVKEADKYISSLKHRIKKWRDFFKSPTKDKLTDKTVIGLVGELNFIKELMEKGITNAINLWNGPIKSAQDFQGDLIAIEVKTTSVNSMEYVHISSEAQLDKEDREALFLVAYRVERNDVTGIMLPSLIQKISEMLSEQHRRRFWANLTCLGYSAEDAALYNKGYSFKERKVYKIEEGFPKVLRSDLPIGVMDLSYKLALQTCDEYIAEFDEIPQAIKEFEYGQS